MCALRWFMMYNYNIIQGAKHVQLNPFCYFKCNYSYLSKLEWESV